MLKLLAHLSAFRISSHVALTTPHPKNLLPPLQKRHLGASLPLTPLSGTPRRCHRWQKAGLTQQESSLREHAGLPPQAKKCPPKRCNRTAGLSPSHRARMPLCLMSQQIVVHWHCRQQNNDNLSCLQMTSLDPDTGLQHGAQSWPLCPAPCPKLHIQTASSP